MKRISFALASMGLTVGAFAALPAATDPTIVNVPQLPGSFVVGVSGYYLQAANTNGDLDYASVNFSTSSTFASNLQNVDPGYDWGWGVNVGYIFPNTGNDINLSYFQLNTSDTASVFNNNLNGGISPIDNNVNFTNILDVFGVPTNIISDSASAKAEYDLNQVDLTAGQYINIGCRLSLHPFAGLRWAEVERKLNSTYSNNASLTNPPPDLSAFLNQSVGFAEKSDFQGIGPIVGIDASYYVGMGFGIVGHFDSALLVGDIDASTNVAAQIFGFLDSGAGISVQKVGSANFSASNSRRVVPVLDAKLGADYTYVFNNSANSDLTLEAGWMVSNYFNAVDRLQTETNINGEAVPPAVSFTSQLIGRTTSDFGIQGPYVSLVAHI